MIATGTVIGNAEGSEGTRIRVASISFVPEKTNLDANSDTLEKMFREASAGGAQLAVAPEGILEGYFINEILAGKIPAEKMKEVAVPVDHPQIERFRKLADDLNMCIVFGYAEQTAGEVFNTAIFIDHQGLICGRYRKMQLAEGYHPDWWFNRLGTQSRAFDTPIGRCGILICNDRWNPVLAKIPALDGAQFLVIPSFGSTSTSQDEAVLSRGRENHLPIVEANVGVRLIVSEDQIVALSREKTGITYGEILIPAPRPADVIERDRVEQEFIVWRTTEMRRRIKGK